MKAVQLVKHDKDSRKFCRGLAERSRFVWLQPDWISSREQVFPEDGGLDRTIFACGQRAPQRFLPDLTWKGVGIYDLLEGRISSQAATWSTPT